MMPRSNSFAISLDCPPKWRTKVRERRRGRPSRHLSRQNGGRGLAEAGLFINSAILAARMAGFAICRDTARLVPPISLLLWQSPPGSVEIIIRDNSRSFAVQFLGVR